MSSNRTVLTGKVDLLLLRTLLGSVAKNDAIVPCLISEKTLYRSPTFFVKQTYFSKLKAKANVDKSIAVLQVVLTSYLSLLYLGILRHSVYVRQQLA